MYCSNCDSDGHLAGNCPVPRKQTSKPVRSVSKFEKIPNGDLRLIAELEAEIAELRDGNEFILVRELREQLAAKSCPECEKRRTQTRLRVAKHRAAHG